MKPPAAAAATPKPMLPSSPAQPEKLPAPGLARLLHGKSAGRTRARSAASPMFVSRSKSVGRSSSSSAIDPDAGDPSSPKVTCIGQVRIRRNRYRSNRDKSKSNTTTKNSSRSEDPYRCRCLCRLFLSPYRFFFCWQKQKKKKKKEAEETAQAEDGAPPTSLVKETKIEWHLHEENEKEEEEEVVGDKDAATPPPPKNALLLMRCRSAPHNRSPPLALSRFPVSPAPASETEEEEQIEKSKEETSAKDEVEEEGSRSSSTSQAPAGLTRCKSEPAKKGERLMEVSHCKWNGSGEGGMGAAREVGPTLSPAPPPPTPPILLH